MATSKKRAERRYRVRYRDPTRRKRSKTLPRLGQTRRFKLSSSRGWPAWLPLGGNRRGPPYCWGPRSQSASAGTPLPGEQRVDVDRATNAAVSALGRDAFTRVLERGRE